MVEQLAFAEVAPTMTYEEIEKIVIKTLREYRELDGLIRLKEKQALGKDIGFYINVNLSDPNYYVDKLQPLHAFLRTMKEEEYLTPEEKELVEVAREYLKGKHIPAGIGSQYGMVRDITYDGSSKPKDDERLLKELLRRIGIVLSSRKGKYKNITDVDNVAIERVMRRITAEEEAEKLRMKKENITEALQSVKEVNPLHEILLRGRYIEGKSVLEVIRIMNISEKTYERRKPEAILKFAMFAGITG